MSDAAALSPLDRLLLEMEEGGDFPALSRTIGEINRAIGDENSRANILTDIILRDIALTKKLLRLVNAAHYGAQPISTISRAVVILGFDAVRDAAVTLMLFEHLQNACATARRPSSAPCSAISAGSWPASISSSAPSRCGG